MTARLYSLLPALLLLLVPALQGCSSNPTTGGTDVTIMSQGQEVSIGQEMHDKMVEEGAIYDNPELQAYVDRIGQRLVAHSDKSGQNFTFTVIDSPDINAFATPGGFVYVNRGLMTYLDNEAELAGVIAHEIAHITARHAARQQTANVTSQVLAATAYILTGSRDIADASTMYGTELVRGYGREHELEADSLGAEYMHKSGYDVEALLQVIGVLKTQEQFQRVKAKETGKKTATYHGLYATHPRNDQRLQQVVRTAGELDLAQSIEDPSSPGEFQRQMEGLVWGDSIQGQQAENRFFHNKLKFTFEHPEDWTVKGGSQAIIATAAGGDPSLTLTIKRKQGNASSQQTMENTATGELNDGTALEQAGLQGYTAIASAGGISRRLAVIDYNGLDYLFEGSTTDFTRDDPALLGIIESFRPMHPREQVSGKAQYIRYIQVPRGATMASLAAGLRIPDAEAKLRLINGFYPRGEPRTGDWIKMIR